MGRSRHVGIGRAGSYSLGRLCLGLALAGFALATILRVLRPIVARRYEIYGMLPPSDLDPFIKAGIISGLVGLAIALVSGVRAVLAAPPAWLVQLFALSRGAPDPEALSQSVEDELARDLRGRREGDVVVGRFRDREVRLTVVRDGLETRHYDVEVSTHLGAPRAGKVLATDRLPSYGEPASEGASPLHRSLVDNAPQWTGLFRVYRVESVEFEEGKLRARVTWGGAVLPAWEEAGRIHRLLERLAVVSEGHAGLELKARASGESSERCPYCHADLLEGEGDEATEASRGARKCEGCGTRYHEACWDELGGCAVLGCRARARPPERVGG